MEEQTKHDLRLQEVMLIQIPISGNGKADPNIPNPQTRIDIGEIDLKINIGEIESRSEQCKVSH